MSKDQGDYFTFSIIMNEKERNLHTSRWNLYLMPKGLEDLNFWISQNGGKRMTKWNKMFQTQFLGVVFIEIYLVIKLFIKTYPVYTITKL